MFVRTSEDEQHRQRQHTDDRGRNSGKLSLASGSKTAGVGN